MLATAQRWRKHRGKFERKHYQYLCTCLGGDRLLEDFSLRQAGWSRTGYIESR
ncbi:MAG: hypothetical protein AB4352_19015 [Hormoscilla sp.]